MSQRGLEDLVTTQELKELRNGFALSAAGRLVAKQQTNGANGSVLLGFSLCFCFYFYTLLGVRGQ